MSSETATKADIRRLERLLQGLGVSTSSENERDWRTATEVSERYGLCKRTLTNTAKSGKISQSRIGRIKYYDINEIDELLAENAIEAFHF